MMYALLLTLSLAASAPPDDKAKAPGAERTTPISLDGNWTIVTLEKNGQPVPDAKQMTVMIKGNTITCSGKEGKPAMTWQVQFADMGMLKVKATEGDNAAPKESDGVYVLTSDMLAVCLHNSKTDRNDPANPAKNDPANAGKNDPATAGATGGPNQKSQCSIILKREGSGSNDQNKNNENKNNPNK